MSEYGLDDLAIGVRSPTSSGFFLLPLFPDRLCSPPKLLSKGTGGKAQPGRDADHSPLTSAEVTNEKELYLLSSEVPPWRVVEQL
jgi:hypothetical protein